MALRPEFSASPYAIPRPDQRWFPASEDLRSTAYENLLPPLVAKIREQVSGWREEGYPGVSDTSAALLRWWFQTPSKGIDLTPKYIPADVFDKRGGPRPGDVPRHQIRRAHPERYGRGRTTRDKLTVTIKLTDFSVYCSQGAAEAAIAALKDGKSEVICDHGQLLKIGKN